MSCVSRKNICFLAVLLGIAPAALAQPIAITKDDASMAALTDNVPLSVPASGESVMPVIASPAESNNAASITMSSGSSVGVGNASTNATPALDKDEDSDGIPESVNNIVDDLRKSEDNVSLEDMARAQDALTRLDLLLDIEKRISDIQKERDARDEQEDRGFGSGRMPSFGALPAGALGIPMPSGLGSTGSMAPASFTPPISSMPSTPASSSQVDVSGDYKVDQITGINGRYSAKVKTGGIVKTVEQGDKIGRYTVQKISAAGVTLVSGKETKVLSVETNGAPMIIRPR